MMRYFYLFLVVICGTLSLLGTTHASSDAIKLSITPIKQEATVSPNGTTTGTVTVYNTAKSPYKTALTSVDCISSNNYGTPTCSSGPSSIDPIHISTWISFSHTGVFVIQPNEKLSITYTIHAPQNALPGGHYGAIVFRNLNTTTAPGGQIMINPDIQSLLLVTVTGDIIVNPVISDIIVSDGGPSSGSNTTSIAPTHDVLSLESAKMFFSLSDSTDVLTQLGYKGKTFMMLFTDPVKQEALKDFVNPLWETPKPDQFITTEKFQKNFTLPVNNHGTVHIQPNGIIKLYDENGELLKGIGKEIILDENGVATGKERIVDYLIINEEGGNVLPGINRLFNTKWEGFIKESRTPEGTIALGYESPAEYYQSLSDGQNRMIYPWEKLSVKYIERTFTARADYGYIHPITKSRVEFHPEFPVTITYKAIVKTWNTGLIFWIILFVILFAGVWLIFRKKKDEDPTYEYDDEISALEKAHQEIITGATKPRKRRPSTVSDEADITPSSPSRRKKSPAVTRETDTGETESTPPKKRTRKTTKETPES